MKVYSIHCQTGCSCCNNENHSLGLFESSEDAQRRVTFFLDPNANNNPIGSQYARKGRYDIMELEAEPIAGDRLIIGSRVVDFGGFAVVHDDGTAIGEERIEL